jgi:hypothetical protein
MGSKKTSTMPSMLKIDTLEMQHTDDPFLGPRQRVAGLDDILDNFAGVLWGKSSPNRSPLHMQCRWVLSESALLEWE